MKKTVILLIISIGFAGISFSQDCGYYFGQKKGVTFRRANYIGTSSKPSSYLEDKIIDIQPDKVTVETQSYDKDNKAVDKNDFSMTCNNGVYKIDFATMLVSEGGNFKITGDNLEFPSNLSVGMTMNEAKVKLTSSNAMMNMDMRIYNRKVEAKESIKTPAGTFECYKIVSTTETIPAVMPTMKITSKSILWIDVKNGNIKMENYDQAGKLSSSSILESIK